MNWMRWKRAVEAAGQRLGQQRLADAGHVLDEQVALGQQGDEGQVDDLGLAQQHAGHVGRSRSSSAARPPVDSGGVAGAA